MSGWPTDRAELVETQRARALAPTRVGAPRIGGCFVCFARGGSGPGPAGDPAWAAAALGTETRVVTGTAPDVRTAP